MGIYHCQADLLEYRSIDDRDYANLYIRLGYKTELAGWNLEIAGKFEKSYLANQQFQEIGVIKTSVSRGLNSQLRIGGHYSIRDINSNHEDYSHLSGRMQLFELNTHIKAMRNRLKLVYVYEWNDRKDDVLVSYSPVRNSIGVINTYQFSNNSLLSAGLYYRTSKYPAVGDSAHEKTRYLFGAHP